MGKAAAVIQPGNACDRLDEHQRFFRNVSQALVNLVETLLIEINIRLCTLALPQHFTQQGNARNGVFNRVQFVIHKDHGDV
ncbi:hypothetical protein D3C80_1993190 [compost metagenome]